MKLVSDLSGNPAVIANSFTTASANNVTAIVGTEVATTVAQFSVTTGSPIASDFSATIDWGGGDISTGVITQTSPTTFTISGSNVYNEAGSYDITVTLASTIAAGYGSASLQSSALVSLQASGVQQNLTAGSGFNWYVGTFAGAPPIAGVEPFSAVVNWGDGDTTNAYIIQNANGVYAIEASHDYLTAGVYEAEVVIDASSGQQTVIDDAFNVSAPPASPQPLSVLAALDAGLSQPAPIIGQSPITLSGQVSSPQVVAFSSKHKGNDKPAVRPKSHKPFQNSYDHLIAKYLHKH